MDRKVEPTGSNCPDEQLLGRFLRQELSAAELARIDAHIEACETCEERLNQAMTEGDAVPALQLLVCAAGVDEGDHLSDAKLGASDLEVRGVLGRGGMGIVYRVFDRRLERELALKTIDPRYAASPRAQSRFRDEMILTARLQHPGIIPIHASGVLDDGRPYYLMQVIHGKSLDAVMLEHSRSEADRHRLLQVLSGVCSAVGYAHRSGIIHRDLKPGNILVGEFAEVKVLDWGLARWVTRPSADSPEAIEREISDDDENTSGRRTEGAVGTYGYMSPEQATNDADRVGYATDVFALGAILLEMLTGSPVGREADEDVNPRLLIASAPPELAELCVRCLATDPASRPADAGVLAGAIRGYLEAAEARVQEAQTERRMVEMRLVEQSKRRRVVRNATAGIICVLLTGVIGTTVGLVRARTATKEADGARAQAEARATEADEARARTDAKVREWDAVLSFTEDRIFGAGQFANAQGFIGGDDRLSDLLRQAGPRIDRALKEHPASQARIRSSMGRTFLNLGKFAEAEHHFKRAADIYIDLYGADDSRYLQAIGSYGVCADIQGKPEGRLLVETCFNKSLQLNGYEDEMTCKIGMSLATILVSNGEADRALNLANSILESRARRFGENNQTIVDTLAFLGMVHRTQKRYQESLGIHEKLLQLCTKNFGEKDRNTLMARYLVAMSYAQTGRGTEAIDHCRETVRLKKDVLGPAHFDTLRSYILLIGLLEQPKKEPELRAIFNELPDFTKIDFGTQPEVAAKCLKLLFSKAKELGLEDKQKQIDMAIARCEALVDKKMPK